MKTFQAIFTKEKIPNSDLIAHNKYTFNTEDNIEEGQLIYLEEYKKSIQVIHVFDSVHSYVNIKTGFLTNSQKPYPYVKIKIITTNENKTDSTVVAND